MTPPRTKTDTRERGRRLLSRVNRWTTAAAVGLAAAFSFVAAETTHVSTKHSSSSSLAQPSQAPSASSSSSSSGTVVSGGS